MEFGLDATYLVPQAASNGRLCHNVAAGACGAGVDSVFITGGIHAKDIAGADGLVDDQRVLNLMTQHGGKPTYTMPCLQV